MMIAQTAMSGYTDLALEKNSAGIAVPCFQGAHRLNHVSSGFFVRRHGTPYGRAVQGIERCAVILGRGTATCTVLPTPIAVEEARFKNLSKESAMTNIISIGSSAIRQQGGLYSLNDLHKASGRAAKHRPSYFLSNDQTKALISEINQCRNSGSTLKVINGGQDRGTYACKELVIAYAAWISPAFHLQVIRVFLAQTDRTLPEDALPKPELNLLNLDTFKQVREIANQFQKESGLPTFDIPDEVLAGIVAKQFWKTDFTLRIDFDGNVQIVPRQDPYTGLQKAIADPSNIGLKDSTIEGIAQACITALSHRAKCRESLVLKLRGAK